MFYQYLFPSVSKEKEGIPFEPLKGKGKIQKGGLID